MAAGAMGAAAGVIMQMRRAQEGQQQHPASGMHPR
jgi:hypothetical protein